MTLDNIPDGEIVILDSNIFLYSIRGASNQCKVLLRRSAEGEIFGILTSHVLAEVMHRLMMAEANENGWITKSNPAKQLAEKPDRVKLLFRYQQAVHGILAVSSRFEPVRKEDFIAAMNIQKDKGFLINDALLIAIADRLQIKAIASADKKFNVLREKIIYSPNDIIDL